MTGPAKLRLLGRLFTVQYVRIVPEPKEPIGTSHCPDLEPGDVRWGDIYHAAGVIHVRIEGHAESGQAETLLHEIIEHLDGELELGMTHPAICAVSRGLFAVLRDNPKLAKFLLEVEP